MPRDNNSSKGADGTVAATATATASTSCASDDVPRVIVFDLDGTLWDPEMYQLRGGAPFKPHRSNPNIAIDRTGEEVHLIGETREVLQHLATDPKWRSTHLAISSTCDYPAWAGELLRLFHFTNVKGAAVAMDSLFGDFKEIYYAGKEQQHKTLLRKIHEVDPSVTDFKQFLFFDNQMNNTRSVSAIGVPCCYCASGMVKGTFEKGLRLWQDAQAKL